MGNKNATLTRPPYTTPHQITMIRIRDFGSGYGTTYYTERGRAPLDPDPEIETLGELSLSELCSQAFTTHELAEAAEDFIESLKKKKLDDYNELAGAKHKWPWKRRPKQC